VLLGYEVQPVQGFRPFDQPQAATWQTVLQETATGRPLLGLPQPDRHGHLQAFAPDGRSLVTATYKILHDAASQFGTNAIHLWELASGGERLTITVDPPTGPCRYEQLALAPDGHTLAAARSDHVLEVWDLDTGAQLLRRSGFEAPVRCLAFAPDGKVVASGHADSTILVWDLAPEIDRRRPARRPREADLEAWWAALASPDARKAHVAIVGLAGAPGPAVALLRERLRPAAAVPAEKVRRLVADLESERFERREEAARELADLGDRAEPALRRALEGDPSPELRRHVETLLGAPRVVHGPERLRHLRAVEVLERVETSEARQVLAGLAKGEPLDRLTREAKGSLERLTRRRATRP
jgi:hypothetical protein